jgi:hypothetical protein
VPDEPRDCVRVRVNTEGQLIRREIAHRAGHEGG